MFAKPCETAFSPSSQCSLKVLAGSTVIGLKSIWSIVKPMCCPTLLNSLIIELAPSTTALETKFIPSITGCFIKSQTARNAFSIGTNNIFAT